MNQDHGSGQMAAYDPPSVGGGLYAGVPVPRLPQGTICLPKGASARPVSLKDATPKGMPITVAHSNIPAMRWPRATRSHRSRTRARFKAYESHVAIGAPDHHSPEGPEGIASELEGLDPERDRDDEQQFRIPGDDITQGEPERG